MNGGRTLIVGLLRGPVLIVAPLSTVPNWTAELRLWCPSLNCVTYIGNAEARQTAREYEFPKAGKGNGGERCKNGSHLDVLLTSYEVAMVAGIPASRSLPRTVVVSSSVYRAWFRHRPTESHAYTLTCALL